MIIHQPQTFFGIPVQQISPSSWEETVFLLKDIRRKSLPYDKLETLLVVAKRIPELFQKEHLGTSTPLGADDFLPIFIYNLVKAKIPHLIALNEELQGMCDPENRMSETGYYLATLEASIQHILEADIHADSEVLFPHMLHKVSHEDSDSDSDQDNDQDNDEDERNSNYDDGDEVHDNTDIESPISLINKYPTDNKHNDTSFTNEIDIQHTLSDDSDECEETVGLLK